MLLRPPAPFRIFLCACLLGLTVFGAGCASDDRPPARGRAGLRRPFPTLDGQETFFQGTITAEVLVGAMTGFDRDGASGGGSEGGRHHRGGGGRMHMRMAGGMHDGGAGGYGGDQMGRGPDDEGPGGGERLTRRADAMGSPPVMIHLRLINQGHTPADVVIADFLSPLGNFVVRPEKLSLQPGEAREVEPMTSRLAEEISSGEISLALTLGAATETKTITLALKPEAPTPAP